MANLGILHPGSMGISVAVSAQKTGFTVYWVSKGRSAQTRERAERFGLFDAQTVSKLCECCQVIVSVCPPDAAEAVVEQVLVNTFQGLYLDANAIAPQRAIRLGEKVQAAGASFVDGGIIGGPAWEPGKTWLYLSGERAEEAAACFTDGPLETCVIGKEVGKASALKMCYAAYTKGTTALLCGILATADKLGVRDELAQEWSRDGSEFATNAESRVRRVTAKAWRFAGEMEEIAATFQDAGLPEGFHRAAGDIYCRLAGFKDAGEVPELEEVLSALQQVAVD